MRLAALLAVAALASPFAATSIGRQDIAGLLAHNAEAVERARLTVLPGTFRTLATATFAWRAATTLLPGSAIPEPPRLPPLALDINRTGKTDRLGDQPRNGRADPGLPDSFADAGVASETGGAGSAAGAATGTGTAALALTAADTAFAGVSTDPYDAADELADANDLAAGGLDAGDPTGDPSELEAAARAGDDALVAGPGEEDEASPAYADPFAQVDGFFGTTQGRPPIYRQASLIFGLGGDPAQHFFGGEGDEGDDEASSVATKGSGDTLGSLDGPSPAERLGLDGRRRARAEKCLAEAVYFESRGEPERGQVAVAQVVMNRVFSGYYPADVCRAVYQNANRKFGCQFTFACDNVKDVVTEPRLWQQAERIAADMLDGKLWDSGVGRATHYHAQSVRPFWIREMRKLERIGEHTFYRPRRWTS